MIDKLDCLVEDISGINSKLILLIGPPRSGKSNLLEHLAMRRQARVLNVGASLGRELLAVPRTRRHLQIAELLKGMADTFSSQGLLFLDNLEILFDWRLQLNPLDLLKRHAYTRRVVAVWPGDIRENRLYYAETSHPEFRDYAIDGFAPFNVRGETQDANTLQ